MIPIRLPWRPRARPSATLHEILICSIMSKLGSDPTSDRLVCQADLQQQRICNSQKGVNRGEFIVSPLSEETSDLNNEQTGIRSYIRPIGLSSGFATAADLQQPKGGKPRRIHCFAFERRDFSSRSRVTPSWGGAELRSFPAIRRRLHRHRW